MLSTAERIRQLISSPCSEAGQSAGRQRSLITGEPWDRYHLESLLAVRETYRENREFGFLLRHYWIPATELRYRQSSRLTLPDGTVGQRETVIDRRMARCRSNECLWREKVFVAAACSSAGDGTSSPPSMLGMDGKLSESLCSYDCYEQTYHRAKPIEFGPLKPEQKEGARREALYRLPMTVFPGPVPLGFTWYAKVGDDYMNFRLDAEEHLDETSVLVICRDGRYTARLFAEADGREGRVEPAALTIERKGVTLFAWNRSVVLEDRIVDRVVETTCPLTSCVGATNQIVTRLVRSCPIETDGGKPA